MSLSKQDVPGASLPLGFTSCKNKKRYQLDFISLEQILIFFQKCFLKTLQQIRQYNELKAKETKEEAHLQLQVTAV